MSPVWNKIWDSITLILVSNYILIRLIFLLQIYIFAEADLNLIKIDKAGLTGKLTNITLMALDSSLVSIMEQWHMMLSDRDELLVGAGKFDWVWHVCI